MVMYQDNEVLVRSPSHTVVKRGARFPDIPLFLSLAVFVSFFLPFSLSLSLTLFFSLSLSLSLSLSVYVSQLIATSF